MTTRGSATRNGFGDRLLASFLGTLGTPGDLGTPRDLGTPGDLGDRSGTWAAGHRRHAGYGFGRRFLASFLRVDLPHQTRAAGMPWAAPPAAVRRPGSPWFSLPTVRPVTANTVMAASGERIAAAQSPDGSVEFSLYREAGGPEPDYALEVVLRSATTFPALVQVRYPAEGQVRPADLIIPVIAAPLGLPTSRITLPGFVPGLAWESAGLITPDAAATLGQCAIEASIAAASTRATLDAWKRVCAGGDALAAVAALAALGEGIQE